jgi:FKBP-type peptidyl-prolyl cis-trans isomerase SlpA
MTAAVPTVQPDSYLTLHYRLSLAESGGDVVSTFGGPPATLQLGAGQMAEPLERCLLGLAEGSRARFELAPDEAFGARTQEFVRRIARAEFDAMCDEGSEFAPGALLQFPGPGGATLAGVLREIDAEAALVDFNHPLAGQRVCLEVEILGVL